jgi:hypothetical protein
MSAAHPGSCVNPNIDFGPLRHLDNDMLVDAEQLPGGGNSNIRGSGFPIGEFSSSSPDVRHQRYR